ncbi:MAG TPA: Wzt carbohydrate-binding domain-containing protein [Burkholderiales bacterium]|nr:Wzt carbohydrate-binding domain-containing protein [Burkholderiales bacterium]
MPIAFRLPGFDATAPAGAVIGIIGEDGAGKSRLLRSAEVPAGARYLGPDDALDLSPAPLVLIEHTFARHDALARNRAALALDGLRRAGSTVLLVSHEEDLLLRVADEVWWIDRGRLAGRGDPAQVLTAYRRHIAARFHALAEGSAPAIVPRMRGGDGRAEVLGIETLGENGCPTMVWRSGELAVVKVRVRFQAVVADPVIGIMIRTRIGLNVYGTNTELEKLKLGPRAAGDTIEVTFAFRCELCPEEYTITAASHDPDGVWHDWLEDAVAFAVSDERYTAGVANLRARVSFAVISDRG